MTPMSEIRFWIDMALECVRRDHTPALSAGDQKGPFLSARALGLALGALHDPIAAAAAQPLLLNAPTAGLAGHSVVIAAAAACNEVLSLRYPKQLPFLRAAWDDWLDLKAVAGAGAAEQAGRAYGAAVHGLGAGDAAYAMIDKYNPTGQDYTHQRPAHEPMQSFSGGLWGQATPLKIPLQDLRPPPGRINGRTVNPNSHYLQDFEAVRAVGADLRGPPPMRSLEQEIAGIFWGHDGPPEIGTPPRFYLQVALRVLDDLDAAGKIGPASPLPLTLQVVAAIAVAMADAGIQAWYYKYEDTHMMWRPAVGIPKAPGGQGGSPVPSWLPLGRPDTNGRGQYLTPDFPSYPSGHATFGGAAFHLLRLLLVEKGLATFDKDGVDDVAFSVVSDEFNGRNLDPRTGAPRPVRTRSFDSLWSAIVENSLSRAYLGVHWVFDGLTVKDARGEPSFGTEVTPRQLADVGGVWLGVQIANVMALALGVSQGTVDNGGVPVPQPAPAMAMAE